MPRHKSPFLLDPNKNSLFYLVLFVVLSLCGVQLYQSWGSHYSIVGSVASFLGLFAAFQSWKAADSGSKKTDEALHQMTELAGRTRTLVEQSNGIESQMSAAITTISDATRQLHKGYSPVIGAIRNFLEDAANSEWMALLTDSAAIGSFYATHPEQPLNERETKAVSERIHELLLARAVDCREFYLATLPALEATDAFPPAAADTLYQHYALPLWQRANAGAQLLPADWHRQRDLHAAARRQVSETFHLFADHPAQVSAGIDPVMDAHSLPLQLFIRYDAEAAFPYRALVLFIGQYNMDQLLDARAMETADPELVRTFISMFESLSGLDKKAGYKKLRQNWPL